MTTADDCDILSFGVNAATGYPLPVPSTAEVAELARGRPPGGAAHRRRQADVRHGVAADDQDDLLAVGWAVLFAEDDPNADAIEKALTPLIEHRAQAAGALCKVLKGKQGYQSGIDAGSWLAARNLSIDLVDPSKGLPFYVLLIGNPALIPLLFQYRLDIFWAVGRLDFAKVTDYACYAQSVVAYETDPIRTSKRIGLFAPRHDFDAATQLFHKTVVKELTAAAPPDGFQWRTALAAEATRRAYLDLISGDADAGTPALMFCGGHGMEFPLGDARQAEGQGALVCQDWPGFGNIGPEAWISGDDLPAEAVLQGTIHFIFACYGGGCSRTDTFRQRDGNALQLAEADQTAYLPRALLLHPAGGALAVIAHVDRAFACSFSLGNGAPQTQGFRTVLWQIMRGRRIGNALDRFNSRWGATSAILAEALAPNAEPPADDARLYQLWIARDDARNYILLGDPAVRLRVEAMG